QVHACTDVTGFGLMGHLLDMLDENIDIKLNVKNIPLLKGALEKVSMGLVPAGTYRNKACYTEAGKIKGLELLHEDLQDILFDPQTSGGLLLAFDPSTVRRALDLLKEEGFEESRLIAEVVQGTGKIEIV